MNFDAPAEIRRLKNIIEEKNEEIRQLREAGHATFAFPSALGLTPTENRIVSRLLAASPNILSTSRLMLICAKNPAREANEKTVHVHMCRVRRKLAPFGVTVRNLRDEGYSIEKAGAERLKGLIA